MNRIGIIQISKEGFILFEVSLGKLNIQKFRLFMIPPPNIKHQTSKINNQTIEFLA